MYYTMNSLKGFSETAFLVLFSFYQISYRTGIKCLFECSQSTTMSIYGENKTKQKKTNKQQQQQQQKNNNKKQQQKKTNKQTKNNNNKQTNKTKQQQQTSGHLILWNLVASAFMRRFINAIAPLGMFKIPSQEHSLDAHC